MGNTDSRRRHSTKITLLCIGDPVLDIVCADCPASLVSSLGFAVGGCDLIEEHALEGILRDELSSHALERIPGGSAANVAKCFARLAQRQKATTVQFVGTLGQDESGREYKKSMEATGVDMSHAAVHPSAANGACLCLVTTSGERTMRTALRASKEHTLSNETIRLLRPTWTHFEGYYVYKAGILETMKALRASGSRISFDFASFDVIESHLGLFETILESRLIDVLFCNEEEAMTFAKRRKKNAWGGRSINSPERFAAAMAEMYGMIMVVSQGAKGCVAAAWDDAKHAIEKHRHRRIEL